MPRQDIMSYILPWLQLHAVKLRYKDSPFIKFSSGLFSGAKDPDIDFLHLGYVILILYVKTCLAPVDPGRLFLPEQGRNGRQIIENG